MDCPPNDYDYQIVGEDACRNSCLSEFLCPCRVQRWEMLEEKTTSLEWLCQPQHRRERSYQIEEQYKCVTIRYEFGEERSLNNVP